MCDYTVLETGIAKRNSRLTRVLNVTRPGPIKRSMGLRSALWLMLAACTIGLAAFPVAARDLKFGFTPVLGESKMQAEFEPLMTYLSDSIGQHVVVYIAKDYGDLRVRMEEGTVDIGSFSPFAYVDAAKSGKIRIIAQSLMYGSATYRGVIVARKDSGLKTIADLRGKRFAFVDPKSASGYVYVRAMLLDKGIAPESYFKQTLFAGDHNKVIATVLDGRADAGATYEGALNVAKDMGMPSDNLAILAGTEPIPHDAIAVRVQLTDALAKQIQSSLVNMDKTDAGRLVIAKNKKGLTGFVVGEDKTFDVVRRTAKAGGI